MSRPLRLLIIAGPGVLVLLIGLVLLLRATSMRAPAVTSSGADAIGDFGAAPSWALTDQLGRPIDSNSFARKVIVANFIYTNCSDICPQLSTRMQELQDKVREERLLGSEVQLLSFTTDPARDTPMVLRAYAERHRADADAWRFLTGSEQMLMPVIVKGFHLGVQALPPIQTSYSDHETAEHGTTYEVMHSGRFVLIDRQGHIRAYYDGQSLDPTRVVRDIRDLLRE